MTDTNGSAWRTLLGPLDRPGVPLQNCIRQSIVTAIQSGHLPPGTRLPSSRELAKILGVSRNTVNGAMRALTETGFLESRPRSGVFVLAPPLQVRRARPDNRKPKGWVNPPPLQPSLFRQKIRFPKKGKDTFSFLERDLDNDLFPVAGWREATRLTSSLNGVQTWLGIRDQADDKDLCRELRAKVLPTRGIWAAEDEVLITNGPDHGLFLVSQIYLSGGRTAAIEDPGHPKLRSIVNLFTTSVVHLPVDANGAVPGPDMMRSDVVFLTCPSHYPTTVPMSQQRRQQSLNATGLAGTIIVEYEADAILETGTEQLALKAADRSGNVIHIGSFSSVLTHGLQIGFLVGPAEIVAELRALCRLMLGGPPANNQRALALFLSLGHYQSYLTNLHETMALRYAACEAALTSYLTGVTWQRSKDVNHLWLTLPDGIDGRALAIAAAGHGILVEPGEVFFSDPAAGRRNLRLSLGAIGADRISKGIAILAQVMERQRHGAG